MNNKFEFSKYILVARDKFGNIIMYNTLHQTYVFVEQTKHNDLLRLYREIQQNKINISDPNLKILHEKKMIFFPEDSHEDELNLLHSVYENTINSIETLNLILLPTEKCNFRCIYCYEDFKNGKMNQDVIAKVKELIDNVLPSYKRLHISWFGGEPLLAFDIIKNISDYAVQKCKQMKKAFYSYMTTNGYCLTLDVVTELLKLHVMKFQITIDGCEAIHNKKRKLVNGDGTYNVIIKNLIDIRDNIKSHTIKIVIRINVTNENSLSEIESLKNMFCNDARFVFNIQPVFGKTDHEIYILNSTKKYYDLLNTCDDNEFGELTAEDQICYAAKSNTLMIRADGTIGKCTVNFNDPRNNFGNISSYNWKESTLESFRYNDMNFDCNTCINCCLYPICFGIQCPARRKQACEKIYRKSLTILSKTKLDSPKLFL